MPIDPLSFRADPRADQRPGFEGEPLHVPVAPPADTTEEPPAGGQPEDSSGDGCEGATVIVIDIS